MTPRVPRYGPIEDARYLDAEHRRAALEDETSPLRRNLAETVECARSARYLVVVAGRSPLLEAFEHFVVAPLHARRVRGSSDVLVAYEIPSSAPATAAPSTGSSATSAGAFGVSTTTQNESRPRGPGHGVGASVSHE